MDAALRTRLEALLRGLPVLNDKLATIPMEAELLFVSVRFAGINDLPRAKKAGGKKVQEELDQLAGLAHKLGRHVLGMHRDSLAAVEAQGVNPFACVDELKGLLVAIGRAEIPDTPTNADFRKKEHARQTTLYCANLYKRLTGKPVTRSSRTVVINAHAETRHQEAGEFFEFLTEVFRLLGIKASPASQIKFAANT